MQYPNDNYTSSAHSNSATYNLEDLLRMKRMMEDRFDRAGNPHGSDKQIVKLDNFNPGTIRLFRQFIPGTKPVEVQQLPFSGGNRLSLDSDFRGVVVGESKDKTKKYQIEYVGFDEDQIKYFKDIEENVNRI